MVAVGIPIVVFIGFGAAAIDHKIAAGILIQAANDIQKRGFAAAGRAQNGRKFTPAKRNIHATQCIHLGIARLVCLGNLFQCKHGIHLLSSSFHKPGKLYQ